MTDAVRFPKWTVNEVDRTFQRDSVQLWVDQSDFTGAQRSVVGLSRRLITLVRRAGQGMGTWAQSNVEAQGVWRGLELPCQTVGQCGVSVWGCRN